MAIIKKFSSLENLSKFGVFLNDTNPNSTYFRITELGENLTGGKNGFLIEGSECLKETTEIKIEVLDVNGNPIYFEPGQGVPQYYEGLSKVVGVYVYEDTPIGLGKITILGELKSYFDDEGNKIDVPDNWKGIYNVKWEKQLNINRNLANETRVRFFKRPKISIEEISKPLFTKTIPTVTQSGSLDGIPFQPEAGTDYSNYGGGVLYRLKVNSGPNFTSSIDESTISFPSLNYNPTVKEALSETEVLVDSAHTGSDGLVTGFTNIGYTSSFDNEEGITVVESALTGSFAKIKITNLKSFVGDVARIKVFRKSRNETGDFTLVQEQKLESTELLKDITTTADTELSYGIFNNYNLSNYWITSSDAHPVTLDNTQLLNGVKINYGGSGTQLIYTSESLDIGNDIEYNISFKTKLSGSVNSSKQIHAYLSGSSFTQSIEIISGSDDTLQKFDVSKNIISTNSGSARLVLEVNGDDWYISNVSFRNAQETSFSPDEFTLVQEVPRKLDSEFFDFKFEFYDINNNFIPVEVNKSKNFSGGNLTTTSNVRLLEFETDRTAFRFSSGSLGNPPFQQSRFRVTSNGLTGSITFASAAFDKNGAFINPTVYSSQGEAYPGALNTNNVLTIASFSGSLSSQIVGSITYTASIEDKEEFETITRFEDGEPASALIVTSNQNQFFYKATDLSVDPSGQSITIQAQRKNLASDTTTLTVNSGSGKPGLTQGSTVNGITTFTLNASDYSFGAGNTTYEFSGSDEFGSVFTDRVSVSPVKKLDGISFNTTTNNQTFNATSQSAVSSLGDSSGSVTFRIGSETIQHLQGLSTNNRFDIVGITGSGCVPTNATPTKNEYSLASFNSDSASLTINLNYKDGSGDITDHQQVVNYTKAIAGNIGSDGQDGQDGTDGTDGTDGADGLPGPPGPGVTYRGVWGLNIEYVSSSLRRDVVQGSTGEYYLAKSSHTASNANQQPTSGGSHATYWESFGATFSSVATDVLFSQDVYANRTVNIGTSGSGYPVIALNSDTSNAGTSQNPYMAIGGITSYDSANGIYIGRKDGNSNVMSLKGGVSDGFLTWDGSNLSIKGAITITAGGNAATNSSVSTAATNAVTSGSAAASTAQSNAQSFASTAAANSVTSGSTAATNAATSASNAQSTANTAVNNASTAQSTANSALTAAGSSGSVDPTTRRVIKTASPSGAGLYLGSNNLGYYDSSNWKAYLSSSGEFFLGSSSDSNYLEWNGSSLNIAGAITIQAGSTSAVDFGAGAAASASAAQSNAQTFATTAAGNAATSASNAQSTATSAQGAANDAQGTANDATASAATATTTANTANTAANNAQSTASNAQSDATAAQGTANSALTAAGASGSVDPVTGKLIKNVSPSGVGLFLGADNLGYYANSDWTSYLSSSGDFELSGSTGFLRWNQGSSSLLVHGRISGSQIQGGSLAGSTISVGTDLTAPKFSVDIEGNMTCQDAIVSGAISLTSGVVGLWEAQESSSGGKFVSVNDDMILDPVVPEILFKTGSETKLRLKPANEWSSTAGTNVSINDMDYVASTPNLPTSDASNSYLVYGTEVAETLTATTYTIEQTGTYDLTVGRPQAIDISTPSSTNGGYTDYPNYSPAYAGQTHPSFFQNGGPRTHYFYFYVRAVNQSTSATTDVLVWYGNHRGAYTTTQYWESVNTGYNNQWQNRNGNYYSDTSYNEVSSWAQQSKSITLDAGTYKFQYYIKIAASSGYKIDYDSSGNGTTTYYTTTPSSITYTLSSSNAYMTVVIPSNVVELTSRGLQVLNDSTKYVQIERQGTGWGSQPTLINVKGGKVAIEGDSAATTSDLTAKYIQVSSGSVNIQQFNYNGDQTTLGNIRSTLYVGGDIDAAYYNTGNSTRDMGNTSRWWDEIYADNFNNQSDIKIKEHISGSELGLTFINSLRPVQYSLKNSTKKRTRYGLIAQEVSESLGQIGKTTADFKGLNTGSSKIANYESQFNKSISEIVSSGSHYLSYDFNGTGSGEITQEWVDTEISSSIWTLTYTEFIAPLIKSVQELSAKVTELENQISGSE